MNAHRERNKDRYKDSPEQPAEKRRVMTSALQHNSIRNYSPQMYIPIHLQHKLYICYIIKTVMMLNIKNKCHFFKNYITTLTKSCHTYSWLPAHGYFRQKKQRCLSSRRDMEEIQEVSHSVRVTQSAAMRLLNTSQSAISDSFQPWCLPRTRHANALAFWERLPGLLPMEQSILI